MLVLRALQEFSNDQPTKVDHAPVVDPYRPTGLRAMKQYQDRLPNRATCEFRKCRITNPHAATGRFLE
jgi:hypothetical protein